MPKDEIDLKKLPTWIQYTIALSVTAIVVFAAWTVGSQQPVPVWLTKYFIPASGWLYLMLFSYVVVRRLFKKNQDEGGDRP